MNILIFDTETNGLDNPTVLEIAAALYSVKANKGGLISSISTVLPFDSENHALAINAIHPYMGEIATNFHQLALDSIIALSNLANYSIAYNAAFDAPLIDDLLSEQNWICAMNDINWQFPFPKSFKPISLINIALSLGIGVSFAHRAGDDVRLLVECFNRKKEVLSEMLEDARLRAKSPAINLVAKVAYEDRNLAKNAGFIWESERRVWSKTIKTFDLQHFIGTLAFDVKY